MVCAQAVALIAAWWITFHSVQQDMVLRVEEIILDSNQRTLDRVAKRIEQMGVTDIRYGTEGWRRVQSLVEDLRMPGDGFVCVLDSSMNVICHPRLKEDPSLLGKPIAGHSVTMVSSGMQKRFADLPAEGTVIGRATFGTAETHYIATRAMPSFGGRVVVHMPESGLLAAGDARTPGHIGWSVAIGVSILGLTAAGTLTLIRRQTKTLEQVNESLEREVETRLTQAVSARNALIFGLAKLADHRDSDTGRHLDRICAYSRLLAETIRPQRAEIDDQWIERLALAASMHDIGKVGVPDRILLKPGSLTREEFDVMKRHPLIGADTLIAIRERMGDDDLLRMSIEVALSHHERWDGSGYPFGLAGEQIPLSGRIVALADVYDALTSRRVYKEAFPHARAVEIIRSESGKQFDPVLVEAFERVSDRFDAIRRELQADPVELRLLRDRYEAA